MPGDFVKAQVKTASRVVTSTSRRAHVGIGQVNADLKNGTLAHLPSGVFIANAA